MSVGLDSKWEDRSQPRQNLCTKLCMHWKLEATISEPMHEWVLGLIWEAISFGDVCLVWGLKGNLRMMLGLCPGLRLHFFLVYFFPVFFFFLAFIYTFINPFEFVYLHFFYMIKGILNAQKICLFSQIMNTLVFMISHK